MKTVAFLTLLFVCASKQQSNKPRSVNLALETVLQFDNNDNSADIQIIEKVKGFLDRIKSVISGNSVSRRSLSSYNDYKFTDFVKNAIAILLSYDDDDFEEVLSVVDTEVRKYHYKGCKIYELLENQNVRRFMANQLDVIRDTPAKKIRSRLKKVLRALENGNFSSKEKLLVDSVNLLYLGEAKTRYKKFLDNLLHYKLKSKRYDLDLTKVIRDALRNIVFDYYSGLDNKTRRDLRIKLETFWKAYNNPKKDNHHEWKFKPLAKGKAERARVKKVLNEDISTDSFEISKPIKDVKAKKRLKKTKGRKESMRHGPKEYKADREIVKEDSYIHDTNIAINVEKDEGWKEMPKSSKKARLTFITLYPEKYTFLDTKKSAKTTKSTRLRTAKDEPNTQNSKTVIRKRQEKTLDSVLRHRKKQKITKKKSQPFESEKMMHKHHKTRKLSEMEKMMAEHEKMKKLLAKGSVENTMKEQRQVKKLMAGSDETGPGEEEDATREESEVSVEKVSIRKSKSSKRRKHLKHGQRKKTKHNTDSSEADDVSTHAMNKEEKSPKILEQETHEGLPIESKEFSVVSLRKRNVNDTFTNDTKAPSINFIKKIKDLEEELKNVKAQIKDKPDYIEIPTYDNLDFWAGTTKTAEKTNITKTTKTTKLTTTKATTKTKIKTTVKTKTTKKPELVVLLDKTTTESVNSTYFPVFRSDNIYNISQFKNDEKRRDLVKITENMLEDANLADKTNMSETAHLSDLNNEIDNYTTNIDDDTNDPNFDAIYNKNMNITNHIEHLQKYLNSTKDDPNDKGHMVGKKMFKDLTGILAEPEEAGNKTMPVEKRLSDRDMMKVADPLSMIDDLDALSLK